jgi:hypothetical protein
MFQSREYDQVQGSLTYAKPLKSDFIYPDIAGDDGYATKVLLLKKIEVAKYFFPTFQDTQFNLYSPSLTLEYANYPLSRATCGTAFCHAMTFGVIVQENFSDLFSQRNTFGKFYADYGWVTPWQGVKLVFGGALGLRNYHDLVTDKFDKLGEVSVRVDWKPHRNIALSAGAKYSNQWSTLPTSEWSGYAVNPNASFTIYF